MVIEEGCQQCGSIGTLLKTKDGESCGNCGTVSFCQKIVASNHAKACSVLDDPTACGDDPRADAMPIGFESAPDAASRHYLEAGGSSLSTRKRKQLGCCSAENTIKRQAVADHRARISVSADTLRLNRAVQIQLDAIFQKAGPTHERVLQHIRRTAFQLIFRAQAHSDVCDQAGCDLSLSDVAAQTLAATFVKVLCEQLSYTQGQSDYPLAGVEVNRLDFLRLIDCANSYTGNQSGVSISRATQAVQLNLAAPHTQPCAPCGVGGISVVKSDSMDSLSGSPIFEIRNSLWNYTKTGALPAALRDYALRIVSSGSVDHWLRSVNLPPSLLATVLLAAGAARLGQHEKRADAVMEIAAKDNSVSVSLAVQVKSEALASIRALFVDQFDVEEDGL